jgi:hypothetical protein
MAMKEHHEDLECSCGWLLPKGVVAFALEADLDDLAIEPLPATKVRLICPRCARGHQFFNVMVPGAVEQFELEKRRLEGKKPE